MTPTAKIWEEMKKNKVGIHLKKLIILTIDKWIISVKKTMYQKKLDEIQQYKDNDVFKYNSSKYIGDEVPDQE